VATPGLAPKVHPIQESPAPAVPQSFEETGVGISTLEQLIFKFLYFRGELSGCDLAGVLGLKFSIIDHTLESLKHQHLVTVTRSSGLGNVSAQLSLSEAGRNRARECLDFNQYLGPLPVPLDQYSDFVRRQRPRDGWLTPGVLAGAYRGMVIGPRVLALLGPAVNAGTSFLVYGMPGDGKSYMAENLANVYSSSSTRSTICAWRSRRRKAPWRPTRSPTRAGSSAGARSSPPAAS
jgi:DNA-binding MarR family transcriptional regulator